MKSLRRGYVRPSREQRCYSDDEYREQQRLEQAAALAREAAMAFLVADVNGDGLLSRSEYKSALWRLRALFGADVTAREMTDAALDRLFSQMDANGSGTIEMEEYFLWTLDTAQAQHCGLEAIFRRYDVNGDGRLDALDFSRAVEHMGYIGGTSLHDLFVRLDVDGSGSISCDELIAVARGQRGGGMDEKVLTQETLRFLTALAFHDARSWNRAEALRFRVDTSHWCVRGDSPEELRRSLHSHLLHNSLRGSDLYTVLVLGSTHPLHRLDEPTFIDALTRRLGFRGDCGVLHDVFARLDDDSSGVVGPAELHAFLIGQAEREWRMSRVHLLYRGATDAAAYGPPCTSLAEIEWTAEGFQLALTLMLVRDRATHDASNPRVHSLCTTLRSPLRCVWCRFATT